MMSGPLISLRCQRAKRHHRPWALRTLRRLTSLDLVAELAFGLNDDLPGAAELVEVVDVKRAEIDLAAC